MEFNIHGTLSSLKMSNGEWKVTFNVPTTDSVEMAKISVGCQQESLLISIKTEEIPPAIGGRP